MERPKFGLVEEGGFVAVSRLGERDPERRWLVAISAVGMNAEELATTLYKMATEASRNPELGREDFEISEEQMENPAVQSFLDKME